MQSSCAIRKSTPDLIASTKALHYAFLRTYAMFQGILDTIYLTACADCHTPYRPLNQAFHSSLSTCYPLLCLSRVPLCLAPSFLTSTRLRSLLTTPRTNTNPLSTPYALHSVGNVSLGLTSTCLSQLNSHLTPIPTKIKLAGHRATSNSACLTSWHPSAETSKASSRAYSAMSSMRNSHPSRKPSKTSKTS